MSLPKGVRFIGGPADGDKMLMTAPREFIDIPDKPDFPVLRGESYDPSKPEVFRKVTYRLHPLRFSSGHQHTYAVPADVPLVSAFNTLWTSHTEGVKKDERIKILEDKIAKLCRALASVNDPELSRLARESLKELRNF